MGADSAGRGRLSRVLRGCLKWCFRAFAVLVIAVLSFLLLMPHITDAEPVRALVCRAVERFLPGARLQIKGLRLAPLHPHLLRLEGLRLTPRDDPQAPIVQVARVDCRWRPAELLRGRVHVTALRARSVQVDLRRRRGQWNVIDILPPGPREPFQWSKLRPPLPVRLDEIGLEDLSVSVSMEEAASAELDGLALHGTCELDQRLEGAADVELEAKAGELRAGPAMVRLGEGFRAAARARASDGKARLTGSAAASSLAPEAGGLKGFRPLDVDAAVDAEFDLHRLQVPRLDADLRVGELLSDSLTLAVGGPPTFQTGGTNALTVDLSALASWLAPALPEQARGARIGGRVLALTDLSAGLTEAETEAAQASWDARAWVWDAGAGGSLALPGDSGPVEANLSGFRLTTRQRGEVHVGSGMGGTAALRVGCAADAIEAAVPGLLEGSARNMEASLAAETTLPALRAVRVEGGLWQSEWSMSGPEFGDFQFPLTAGLRMAVREALAPERSRLELQELSGAVGELVPHFGLRARADALGREGVAASGEASVNVEQALALLESLPEELRSRLGELQAQGLAGGSFSVAGRLSPVDDGGLRVRGSGELRTGKAGLAKAGLEAWAAETDGWSVLGATLGPGSWPREVVARGGIQAAGLTLGRSGSGGPTAALGGLEAAFSGSLSELTRTEARAAARVDELTVSARAGDAEQKAGLGPISAEIGGRVAGSPLAGDLEVSEARLRLPGILTVEAPSLELQGFGGEGIDGSGRMRLESAGSLAGLVAGRLPPGLARVADTVRGSGEAGLRVEGRLPLAEQLVACLEGGFPFPRPEPFPLGRAYRRYAPVDVSASLDLRGLAASYGGGPGPEVGLRGATARGTLELAEGELRAEGGVELPTVESPALPALPGGLRMHGALALRDFNEFELESASLEGLDGAVEAEARLRGTGLGRLARPPSPGDLLRAMSFELQSTGTVRPGGLPLPEGLRCEGSAGWQASASLRGGQRLDVALMPRLRDFSAGFRSLFSVRGVDGSLGLRKSWRIQQGTEEGDYLSQHVIERPVELPPSGPGFGLPGGDLPPSDRQLRMASVSVLGTELLRDASLELELEDSRLRIPQWSVRLLGGRMLGSAGLQPADSGRRFAVRGEFAGVDVRMMLPARYRDFAGDSRLNGGFDASLFFAGNAGQEGTHPLKEVTAHADLTHVGSAALDRLLLALDPRAERPGLVRLRRTLGLASPRRATVSLERGFMSGQVELQGLASGLVTRYPIPRLNVARLLEARLVREALRPLGPAMVLLDLLGADRLELAEDGSVRLR